MITMREISPAECIIVLQCIVYNVYSKHFILLVSMRSIVTCVIILYLFSGQSSREVKRWQQSSVSKWTTCSWVSLHQCEKRNDMISIYVFESEILGPIAYLMPYFNVILLSDVIWAFGPKVTRRVTYNNYINLINIY